MRRFLLALAFIVTAPVLALAATLMPPAEQQFLDANGNPLSNGRVFFYIPNTTTFKNTWQDAGETILNLNPVQLDAGGFAIIYGSGIYRQVVKDSLGNTIYDQLTSSTAEVTVDNIQYYASTVSGAPNAVIVSAITPSDYSLTNGKTLRFAAPFSNTGTTTLNPLGLGAKTIKRSTASAGVVALAGGELISGGVYDVFYNGTDYILLNPSITDNPGDVKPFFGTAAPNGYVLMGGQAISRTTFAPLFAAISTNCGVGDGATTFNVCDLRGRSLFGVDTMVSGAANRVTNAISGITGSTLAAAGGNQSLTAHTHTGGTHTHSLSAHTHVGGLHTHGMNNHTHVYNASSFTAGNFGVAAVTTGGGTNAFVSTTGPTVTPTASSAPNTNLTQSDGAVASSGPNTDVSGSGGVVATTSTGAGASENMPPAMMVNFMIRL